MRRKKHQAVPSQPPTYVEHAGMPETQTEAWRARDRADELREVSWLVAVKRIG